MENNFLENLKNAGYQYEDAEITMIPENTVEITDLETAKKVMALYDALEDLDDSVVDLYFSADVGHSVSATAVGCYGVTYHRKVVLLDMWYYSFVYRGRLIHDGFAIINRNFYRHYYRYRH